nr:uncharacterized protein LOC123763214 [Procambarus clarkii]
MILGEEIASLSADYNLSPYVLLSLHSLPENDIYTILEGLEAPRQLTLLTNTLKIARKDLKEILLSNYEVQLDSASWSNKTLMVNQIPIGFNVEATSELRSGYFLAQFETWTKLATDQLPAWLKLAEDPAVITGLNVPGNTTERDHKAHDLLNQANQPYTQSNESHTQPNESHIQSKECYIQSMESDTQSKEPHTQTERAPVYTKFTQKNKITFNRGKVFSSKIKRNANPVHQVISRTWSRLLEAKRLSDFLLFMKFHGDTMIPEFTGGRQPAGPELASCSHPGLKRQVMFYGCQGPSGMLPAMALAPGKGNLVMDLCAALGHNSILIAMMLKNCGILVSNVLVEENGEVVHRNLNRCGVSCSIVTHFNLPNFPQSMNNSFSHVLVDAPCSGSGCIRKYERKDCQPSDDTHIKLCVRLQKNLILRAIDSLRTGGLVVYSTSSLLANENEEVVQYALCERNVKLVSMSLPFGQPGLFNYQGVRFKNSMEKCIRVYSHHHNIQGLFLAKMMKL